MAYKRDYIKSEKELNLQLEGLQEIYSIFEKLNIQMFLSAGTMLGAVRDGDFIPWDWNVSVCCKAEEFDHKFEDFKKCLLNYGFELDIKIKGYHIGISAYKNNIKFIIENLIIFENWRTRPRHKTPARFLKTYEMVKIRNIQFPCPSPAKECCEWQYGEDWIKPIHAEHRNDVINSEHRMTKKERNKMVKNK